jgi:hypothetical protein
VLRQSPAGINPWDGVTSQSESTFSVSFSNHAADVGIGLLSLALVTEFLLPRRFVDVQHLLLLSTSGLFYFSRHWRARVDADD